MALHKKITRSINLFKMKILVFILTFSTSLITLVCGQGISPPTLIAGWERIYIKNTGYFDLPPTMEVQRGKYKEIADENRKIIGFDASQITAQQKGLNEISKIGFEKYARVMVETIFGSVGDFEKSNFNLSLFTPSEISELDAFQKQNVLQNFNGTRIKLIEWFPTKIERINGMPCIHICYKRQFQNEPIVLVHIFYFQNYDRMHSLTLSYRISEGEYWKNDFATILKSFRLTNINR